MDENGTTAEGYIDMVGMANAYLTEDLIFGFETLPTRASASEAARRKSLEDTDNNSEDFTAARYRNTMTEDVFEAVHPRNSSTGKWEPFPKEPEQEGPFVEASEPDHLTGKLLIMQAYGSDSGAAGVSHSFVELYNATNAAIPLTGITLYYADGTTVSAANAPSTATADPAWKAIALTNSIPAKGSYLILGPKQSPTAARHQIADNYGDINNSNFTLSNRAFKVALIRSTDTLTAQNPFDMDGEGATAAGYIDMLGSANEYQTRDLIFGFETAPARNSGSVAARRTSLDDTDDNSADFEELDYRVANGMTNEKLDVRKPRNATITASGWDPFAEPATTPSTEGLMIFQVFGTGATENDSASTHSFIELYNNSDAEILLSAFSVHYADGISSGNPTVAAWTKIDLTGSIPAKGSYLILGKQMVTYGQSQTATTNGNLDFTGQFVSGTATTPDLSVPTFVLSNRSYKVALMSNQSAITVANPWESVACVDLVSAINTSGTDSVDAAKGTTDLSAVNAASGGSRTISKQKSWRRTSLTVSTVTLTDFASKQYSSLSATDIVKFRPRTKASGTWTPEF
jgi:hypothetical protein